MLQASVIFLLKQIEHHQLVGYLSAVRAVPSITTTAAAVVLGVMNNRRRDNSPVWTTVETTAITTAEKEATATGEPRSLWDRVETHLRPQEV